MSAATSGSYLRFPSKIIMHDSVICQVLKLLKLRQQTGIQSPGIRRIRGQVSQPLDDLIFDNNLLSTGGNFNVKSCKLSRRMLLSCDVNTLLDANLDLRVGLGKSISSISSIPVTWTWSYSSASSGLVADVSYDLWLSNVASSGGASSTSTFEVYYQFCIGCFVLLTSLTLV